MEIGKLFWPGNIGELDLYISSKCRLKAIPLRNKLSKIYKFNNYSIFRNYISILIFEDSLMSELDLISTELNNSGKTIFVYSNQNQDNNNNDNDNSDKSNIRIQGLIIN